MPTNGLMTLREDNSPPHQRIVDCSCCLTNKLGIPVKSEYMAQYPDEAGVCRTFQKLQTDFLRNFKVNLLKNFSMPIKSLDINGH